MRIKRKFFLVGRMLPFSAVLLLGCGKQSDIPRESPTASQPMAAPKEVAMKYPCAAAKPTNVDSGLKIETVASGDAVLSKLKPYSDRHYAGAVLKVAPSRPDRDQMFSFVASADNVCGILATGEPVNVALFQPIETNGGFSSFPSPTAGTPMPDGRRDIAVAQIVGLVHSIGPSTREKWQRYPTLVSAADIPLGAKFNGTGTATFGLLFEVGSSTLTSIYVMGQKIDIGK
jgi:hypothetical protein